MDDPDSKLQKASDKRREAEAKYCDLIRDYVVRHNASTSDMNLFGDLLGYGKLTNTMLASNLPLRRKASKFLGQALEDLRNGNDDLTFQFWTLLHSRGHTSDREPTIDLKFLSALADKTFRRLGLNAIYVIELQGLGNYPQEGEGRTIMTHVHAITWAEGEFSIEAALADKAVRKMWTSELEADPIVVRHVAPNHGELSYLAYYLLKPPYEAKMLQANGQRLKSTEKGYRPEFAARLLEALSQMELKELVRSTNGGKIIRRDWQRRLMYWHRSRKHWMNGKIPASFYQDLWSRFRTKKRRSHYTMFKIER